jgi:hypothetical protein
VVGGVLASGGTNDGDDELHDDHTGSAVDQDSATADLLNHDERGRGGKDVDEGGDHADQEGVVDRAKLLEEDGSEVEDEVDTSKLLHHLNGDTDETAAGVGRGLHDASGEAGCPRTEVAGLRNNGHLILVVGNDLSKLVLDVLGVKRLTTDATKGRSSLVELALLDPVTGRFGEKSKTDSEDDSPKELNSDGDTVRSSVAAFLGGVDNAVGEEDTNGNAELVT